MQIDISASINTLCLCVIDIVCVYVFHRKYFLFYSHIVFSVVFLFNVTSNGTLVARVSFYLIMVYFF